MVHSVTVRLRHLGTIDIFAGKLFVEGAVLCIVGCVAAVMQACLLVGGCGFSRSVSASADDLPEEAPL